MRNARATKFETAQAVDCHTFRRASLTLVVNNRAASDRLDVRPDPRLGAAITFTVAVAFWGFVALLVL
jgi:hypothetical protein